jgi:hypothetical protein
VKERFYPIFKLTPGTHQNDPGGDLGRPRRRLGLAAQMGHSSIQVTIDVYGRLLETRKPDAAAKTDALIFGKKVCRKTAPRPMAADRVAPYGPGQRVRYPAPKLAQ